MMTLWPWRDHHSNQRDSSDALSSSPASGGNNNNNNMGLFIASAAAVMTTVAAAAALHSDAAAAEAAKAAENSNGALATVIHRAAIELQAWRAAMDDALARGLQQQTTAVSSTLAQALDQQMLMARRYEAAFSALTVGMHNDHIMLAHMHAANAAKQQHDHGALRTHLRALLNAQRAGSERHAQELAALQKAQ